MTQPPVPPHSRRSPETWASARADYEAGAALRIVAERHGLNIRTLCRHARDDGWQAPEVPAQEAYLFARGRRDYDPAAIHEGLAATYGLDRDEETLLLCPDTHGLCRFAFRRAAECASVSGPTEAMAWIRLAQATARLRRHVDVDVRPMSEVDYRRIAALSRQETDEEIAAFETAGEEDPEVSESVP